MNNPLLLASGSPRRREILNNLGFTVQVLRADIDETPYPNEAAYDYVRRMAMEKNRAAVTHYPEYFGKAILTADTTVALHNQILGKPENKTQAIEILKNLSGQTHQVLTAVCVSRDGQTEAVVQHSDVQFKTLSDAEIAAYIASGEPMDKAGAYGIQGVGGAFVAHLSGSFTGVMGLPVFETLTLLQKMGVVVPPFSSDL